MSYTCRGKWVTVTRGFFRKEYTIGWNWFWRTILISMHLRLDEIFFSHIKFSSLRKDSAVRKYYYSFRKVFYPFFEGHCGLFVCNVIVMACKLHLLVCIVLVMTPFNVRKRRLDMQWMPQASAINCWWIVSCNTLSAL